MIKQIKKWGDSHVIVVSPEEMKVRGWKKGTIIDMSDVVEIKVKGGKNGTKI